jgi:hypothetical protein
MKNCIRSSKDFGTQAIFLFNEILATLFLFWQYIPGYGLLYIGKAWTIQHKTLTVLGNSTGV